MDVLSTPTTYERLVHRYNVQAKPDIKPGQTFKHGGFSIRPFEVPHDASQTVGFIVKHGRKKVVVATDLGHMSGNVRNKFRNSDAIVLESNHDIRMLKDGPYPAFLKKRILGKNGHLSNAESAATLASVISDRTKHIILAHLSQENNKPEIALEESKKLLSSVSKRALAIVPASQSDVSEVIKINGE